MVPCVHSKFDFWQKGQVLWLDTAQLLRQELFIQVYHILHLFVFNDFKQLVLDVLESPVLLLFYILFFVINPLVEVVFL